MTIDDQSTWRSIERLVKIYAYIAFAGVAYGVLAAHVPFIIGHPWSSCEDCTSTLACVLTYHLYEVPIVCFDAYVAWYALKRFTRNTLPQFTSLVLFGVIANVAFFTFETTLILDGLHRGAAEWETLLISSVALLLAGGSGFGIYVHQRLIGVSHPQHSN